MSERTLWQGIRAEARQRMNDYAVRISGHRDALRMQLVQTDPLRINSEVILSLATDLAAARTEYLAHRETFENACRELGEDY